VRRFLALGGPVSSRTGERPRGLLVVASVVFTGL
jgi:hypothetical protein